MILRVGAVTALTGFAEPLFIPDYWNPPTLFDLGQRTGFDIESFVFNFSAGFNATAIYGAMRTRGHGDTGTRRVAAHVHDAGSDAKQQRGI